MTITFIGGGNMADALIGGLLRKKISPAKLRVVEIDPEARSRLEKKYQIKCFDDTAKAKIKIDEDVVVFAVKPQHMEEAARSSGLRANANLVISIAAGIRLNSLSRWLNGHKHLVRAMPNTPAVIGAGITGLYSFAEVTEKEKSQADKILQAVGSTVWIKEEAQLDAVTAISGSGPAYVFYFMEAIERAAQELRLPPEIAIKLVLETFNGATQLATYTSDPIAKLRERVTSKGGTTECAITRLESLHVTEAIVEAVKAANNRARELGEQFDRGK